MKYIHNWIDSGIWHNFYPNYFNFTHAAQIDINAGIEQSDASPLLRYFLEARIIFIQFLLRSNSSRLKSVGGTFARDEYRKDAGDLPQIHAMIRINWDELNE